MFSALTYFFDHSIYFARLHHVNPLCKRQYAFLQMKESPNQKVQERKPLLKFKNTKKNMCLERIWKKCFRHRPLQCAYLIFVIFFTQARFLENKIYTEERVNYDKWILRQNSVNRDLLGQANYKDQDYTKFVTHCV